MSSQQQQGAVTRRAQATTRTRTSCLAVVSRRQAFLSASPFLIVGATWKNPPEAAADTSKLSSLVQQARRQLDSVPKLIESEKWDSVRAILLQPPLSDCWSKNAPMLRKYAEEVADDELAALEAREEAITHLRFLDMAVYNNVFNPIATEGTSGATKELIRSYYEDPMMEWKASVAALDELIQLGKE